MGRDWRGVCMEVVVVSGFIKKYGGGRLRLSDSTPTRPLCVCGQIMLPYRDGYVCGKCARFVQGDALRGRTWVTPTGEVVVQGTNTEELS